MGLFDAFKKKDCEICGKEVGMFGYKKLEDGEICKDCIKLLSPWFDDRRHSTVAQIKQQLAYREENRAALDAFRPTVAYGERYTLRAEVVDGVPTRFVIERGDNYKDENADIVNFKDVTSFNIDIQEHDREIKYRNSKGEEVSYHPPRYEYSYDFYAEINVNHPYFNEMRFQINRDTINLETVERRSGLGINLFGSGFDPTLYPEYRQMRAECDELEELFRAGMQGMTLKGYAAPANTQDLAQVLLTKIPNAKMEELDDLFKKASDITILNRPDYKEIQEKIIKAVNDRAMELHAMRTGNQTAAAAAAAPQASAGPKFCPNCGAPADGGKFCQSCGSKL